ncbi:MAG: hypothetical protein ACKOSS_06795 [Planctomycetia bacterium]
MSPETPDTPATPDAPGGPAPSSSPAPAPAPAPAGAPGPARAAPLDAPLPVLEPSAEVMAGAGATPGGAGAGAAAAAGAGRPRSSSWVEWVTISSLLVMAVVLLWVNASLRRRQGVAEVDTFDLKNPMLDARPGESIEVFAREAPGEAPCIRVRPEAVVLRPASGPAQLGDRTSLRRHPPYLAASERHMPAGAPCGAATPLFEQALLYPLNSFGLPSDALVRPDSVRPLLIQLRGQERLAYEVVLRDVRGWTWQAFLVPEALVTGLVEVRMNSGQPNAKPQVFRYSDADGS